MATDINEVKQVMSQETYECVVCEEDTDGEVYFCRQCFLKTGKEKWFCIDHGKLNHKKKNHSFGDHKVSQNLSVTKHDLQKIEKGAKDLTLAVSNYLVSGTLAAMEKARKTIVSAQGAATGTVLVANAIAAAKESGTMIKAGKELAKTTANSAAHVAAINGVVSVALFGLESMYLGIQWWNGKISGKEFVRRTCKSFARNTCSFAGSTGGMIGGAAAGAFLGPVGAVIGALIGGFIGGIGAGIASDAVFEKYWPDDEQKARRKALDAALKKFQFTKADLKNNKKFNRKILDARFRARAKEVHPDRPGGNKELFQLLLTEYGILLAVLEGDKKVEDVVKMMKQITL